MIKYSCQQCGKEFSEKSHYNSHSKDNIPCKNNTDKIKQLVDKVFEKKLIVEKINKNTIEHQHQKELKYIDLCSGIGGFRIALESIDNINSKCVLTVDIKQDAIDTYNLNFNENNIITEGAIRNIFFIKKNIIYTPSTKLGILNGITRQKVIKLLQSENYIVETLPINFDSINSMDEAFITSSAIGVLPCKWDGWNSDFTITKKLKNQYSAMVKNQ